MINADMFINNIGPFKYDMESETEAIEVPPSSSDNKPDPNWYQIDSNGHFHMFDAQGGTLPTLKYVIEEVDEEITRSEYQCAICNEVVEPSYIPDGSNVYRRFIPGPTHTRFIVHEYTGTINSSERVSFYTSDMFGIAVVSSIQLENHKVALNLTVLSLATRGTNSELPGLPTSRED